MKNFRKVLIRNQNKAKFLTVTFNSSGGDSVEPKIVLQNSKVEKPSQITNNGLFFSGWYKDTQFQEEWNFDVDIVSADITLYAKWQEGFYADTVYDIPGTYTWVAPEGVSSVCVVAIGAGGGVPSFADIEAQNSLRSGAGGGGLGWRNHIPVIPGQSYTVLVGDAHPDGYDGGISYFISNDIVSGEGGKGGILPSPYSSSFGGQGSLGGGFTGQGGGNGGNGNYRTDITIAAGGGGAGGYSGNGGGRLPSGTVDATGGAGGYGRTTTQPWIGGDGGGTWIYGEGTSGEPGVDLSLRNGGRGSFGNGTFRAFNESKLFGGGAGVDSDTNQKTIGGSGAVRIVYGSNRAFPSTNVGLEEEGDIVYDTVGNHTFTVPSNVFSISVICVGGGAGGDAARGDGFAARGGGGGWTAWKNNIPVLPGEVIGLRVGAGGGARNRLSPDGLTVGRVGESSWFKFSTGFLTAPGGRTSLQFGGTFAGDGGYAGGWNDSPTAETLSGIKVSGGGGGAGGYSSNGGNGSNGISNPGEDGLGGSGAGGSHIFSTTQAGYNGGGVGLYGLGTNNALYLVDSNGQAGSGGNTTNPDSNPVTQLYGGGGGGTSYSYTSNNQLSSNGGANGAIRIVWGANKAFPSTNVGPIE
jgi:uncharacterized repeat protein (TIGR02543 family)